MLKKVKDYDKLVEHTDQRSPVAHNCKDPLGCETLYVNQFNYDVRPEYVACCRREDADPPLSECDIGNNSANLSPLVAVQHHNFRDFANVFECIYDRNLIDRIDQSDEAIKKFGADNSLTRAFCASETKTCPPEMKTGCSRFFSTGKDGDYCRALYNEYTPSQRDAIIADYCLRHNTADCKCANRAANFNYGKLKQGNPFSDVCWYIPCANKSRFLVPSEFTGNPTCPLNVCQIVYDISQAHNVDIDHVKNEISCDFSGSGFKPKPLNANMYYIAMILSVTLLIVYALK